VDYNEFLSYMEELKPIYELWYEYLKKSEKYKEVCEWFRIMLKSDRKESGTFYPISFFAGFLEDEINYPLTNKYYQQFISSDFELVDFGEATLQQIAEKNKFPFKSELLDVYLFFKDVHTQAFNAFWEEVGLWLALRSDTDNLRVREVHVVIGNLLDQAAHKLRDKIIRFPEYHELKAELVETVRRHEYLLLSINPRGASQKLLNKLISAKIIEHSQRRNIEPYWFENNSSFPTSTKNVQKLRTYLRAYELKESGKTNSEIADILLPDRPGDPQDSITIIQRYRRNAKKIISNVEKFRFPG